MGSITTEEFNSEVEQLIETGDESLKDDLKCLPFIRMHRVVMKSRFEVGSIRQKLEQSLSLYCNTTTSAKKTTELFLLENDENDIVIESISHSRIPVVSSAPLKLRDLPAQSILQAT
ncbi:PREDICTED: uncharacterized protein LOC109584483 isoform X2 [Amphimedon queenslandica]|uniref:Uncharacterized protein n=1 Tax=Amphimedon queenslandica TaxID=400682 RepID=A0AAN0JFI4_AMPQE|nr:PREDICTED: uncharacterized protein LOC109584483 isoform X2 [Amphimedon queenslandica]|eukprot:XP_019855795.1 PREDICTED: uncharacterized protein LOC109584483 isoform X2 [Amphimedon queenslandica]